jgi:aspartate/methionine/tyrosine aminotransferase
MNYKNLLQQELARYQEFKAAGLKLDMSRGKPSPSQLDLSMDMFDALSNKSVLQGVADYRNYGLLDGIPEFKSLYASILNVTEREMIVGGNSSLNLMYDSVQRGVQFGILGNKPQRTVDSGQWTVDSCDLEKASTENRQPSTVNLKLKWLCPVPGYDRHFAITELFGYQMINVPMTEHGPCMDTVERLIKDETVKGMWCVPKYSNPQGIVYSDETVKRIAALKPAAKDFRVYWDNAYIVHGFDSDHKLLDILAEAKKVNNEDIVYIFSSTSKVSFAGGGVAFVAASERNINDIKKYMAVQTIGHDKINQFMHWLYFKNAHGIKEHMKKHAAILKPKFDKVLQILNEEFNGLDVATWLKPKGGYFISVDLKSGLAKKTVAMATNVGVIFTPAGATFPYGNDPNDSNVRIAPSFPPLNELVTATKVFCCCAKIAYLESLV